MNLQPRYVTGYLGDIGIPPGRRSLGSFGGRARAIEHGADIQIISDL